MPALRPAPIAALAACSGVLTAAACAAPAMAAPASEQMVRQINAVRAAHGLHRLSQSRTLRREAYAHSRSMLVNGYFAHGSLRGPARAEIIEQHSGETPRVRFALRAWLNSPGHRRIVLSRSVRAAGAGVSTTRGSTAWTVRFR